MRRLKPASPEASVGCRGNPAQERNIVAGIAPDATKRGAQVLERRCGTSAERQEAVMAGDGEFRGGAQLERCWGGGYSPKGAIWSSANACGPSLVNPSKRAISLPLRGREIARFEDSNQCRLPAVESLPLLANAPLGWGGMQPLSCTNQQSARAPGDPQPGADQAG